MPNFKKLSIIIVNYQSDNYLKGCLASIFKQNLEVVFEVIVVNNDLPEKLKEIREKFPAVLWVEARKNIGFGAGCNLGASQSQGDWLLFLNPDTELKSRLLPIKDYLEKNQEVGAVGAKILKTNGKIQEWSAGAEISSWNLIRNNLGLTKGKALWESQQPRETFWVSGAALFIPRKIFLETGKFDENFFMYFEDNDLCLRIRKGGKKVVYFPLVTILHFGGKSFSQAKEKKQKQFFYQSQEYYFRKHLGKFQVFWLKILRKVFLRNC